MTREEAIKYLSEENEKIKEVVALTERDFGVSESVWHTEFEAFNLAIAALREQEERSKGCKACEMTTRGLTYKQIEYGALRGDFINDSGGMYIIRYEGGQHSIVCDDDGTEIDIEFCPMCGRRLEEV